jgi:hypothetical protein
MPQPIEGLKLDPSNTNLTSFSAEGISKIRSLRIAQDFEATTDVTKVVTAVALGKPHRHTFFRIHPERRECFRILEMKNPTEFYLVDTEAVPELVDEATIRLLVPGITRDGNIFIWPLRIQTSEKPLDSWSRSALAAMQLARISWIRLPSNMRAGAYDTFTPKVPLPDPEWPETTLLELMEKAFDGRVIDTPDHPVVKALNGEL